MKYPLWLPRPKAWGQAIVLTLEFIPIAIIWRILTLPIQDFLLRLIDRLLNKNLNKEVIMLSLAILAINAAITIYCLSLINQYLWDERLQNFPKWFPRWRCWGEGIWGYLIVLASLILGLFVLLITYIVNPELDINAGITVLGIAQIIGIAYCFHFRHWVSQKFSKQKIKAPDQPKVAIDPIEAELNQIKTEMGLKQMKNVKSNENR